MKKTLLLYHAGKNTGASNLRYVASESAIHTAIKSKTTNTPFVCLFTNVTAFSISEIKLILLSFNCGNLTKPHYNAF